MRNKCILILSYVVKGFRDRWTRKALLSCIVALMLFSPLYVFEELQNKTYMFVVLSSSVSFEDIKPLYKLRGVIYVVGVSQKIVDENVVFEVSREFKKFACKFILKGRLPKNDREVAILVLENVNVMVGDFLLVGSQQYRVVGFLDSKCMPVPIIGKFSSKKLVLVKNVENVVSDIHVLIVGVWCFADIMALSSEIQNIFDQEIYIDTSSVYLVNFAKVFMFSALVAGAAVAFLIVLDVRRDSVILFSIGWLKEDVLRRIFSEFLLLNFIGYLACLSMLYFDLVYIVRYYLFFDYFVLLFILSTIVLNIFATYVFSRFLVFKGGVEVLLT